MIPELKQSLPYLGKVPGFPVDVSVKILRDPHPTAFSEENHGPCQP
jgi:hypothetical protein